MIGQTLRHYRIEAQLGAGGMGVVYRAHDTQLGRTVAIKLVGERLAEEPTARERLLREARTASALNHPHICTIHEVGEVDGQVYIVMEYVEGRPLGELLEQARPVEAVVRYGIQIADALAHAHDHGVVHRDLKTANVVITPEGRAKVLDFGLAKRLPGEDLTEEATRSENSFTEAGALVGTLHYLAPEMLHGQPADTRTDIWALGVVLYEMASGSPPFAGRTRYEVTSAILNESPMSLPARVPPGVRAVIQRCLEKDPGQRYQRASEVRAALEAIQSGPVTLPAVAPKRPSRRGRLLATAGVAALLSVLAGIRWFGGGTREIGSIAVLPFVIPSADSENEYLTDGITESVIASLSELPRLKVIAFSSVVRYKGRDVDPKTVVRDLGVSAILTGRIVRHGDSLSISAELVNTSDRSRLWGEHYDAKLADILTVQGDISRQISAHLGRRLSGEKNRAAKRYTENNEAYQLYLKGRYHWYKFTSGGYEKSLEYYQQAIDRDPAFALAYSGTADTYVSMFWEGYLSPSQALPKIETATQKALEIDDMLGEAHVSLASLWWARWNWSAAEKEYRRALELSPSYVPARRFFAQNLRNLGRWDEAFAEMRRAQELDPLNVETNKTFGALYFWAGRTDEAIEQYRKTLELDPNAADVHDLLADAFARKKMYPEAFAAKQKALSLSGDEDAAAILGHDYAALGYPKALQALARRQLDAYLAASKEQYVPPMAFAYLYAVLDDKDRAFEWLEKTYAEHHPVLSYLKSDPHLESLRSDPRFGDLLRRIGLPP